MRYTLKQLEVFLAIARSKNTSLAAEQLFLSQSAVSAALQAIEKNYNIQLFDRRNKRLELNEVGETLRKKAEALIAHAEEFERELIGHEQIGHLNVGASFTIANHLAITCLAGYLQQYPDAKVELFSANSPDVVSKVLNYEVDIGMIESEINHKDLELIPWLDDKLVVFCSSSHPLANKKRVSDTELKNSRWILREPDSGARQTFNRAFRRMLPSLDIYLEFKHNEAVKKAVEAGLGIGCLSEKVLQGNFRDGSLVPLTIPARHSMWRTFYFVLNRDCYRTPAIQCWLEQCQAMALAES
jgi:DNA-binding transcriptional LysR family regulator